MIDPRSLIPVATFAAGLLLAGTVQGWRYGKQIAEINAAQAQAVTDAVTAARAEEQRRINTLEVIADDTRSKLDAAQADAATARAAAAGLRQQLADYRQRTRCNTATAGGGAPAEDPLYLLSDLLSRADERAGELAEFADRAHIAGRACEAAYDSLRVKSSGHVEASSPALQYER